MADIHYRFTLTHEGTSQQISEPLGWKEIKLILERDPEYHSLIEGFESPLIFYGNNGTHDGGKDFIETVLDVGIDEIIDILIEATEDDVVWETFFDGMLDLENAKTLDARKIQIPVVRNSFWTKFKSREETPVDLQSTTDLDGEVVTPAEEITVELPSQIINKRTQYTGHSGDINTIAECTVATTADITLSGLQTIDGIALIVGRRVLVKNQTDQTENGVYIVSTGAWTRASDANTNEELETGIVYVKLGTTNADKTYKQTTTPVTLGSSNIVWVEYNYVDEYLLFEHPDDGTTGVCDEDMFNVVFSATVDPNQKEIEESYTIPVVAVESYSDLVNQLEILEGYGLMTISGSVELSYAWESTSNSSGTITDYDLAVKWFYQINEDSPVLLDSVITNVSTPVSGMQNPTLTTNTAFNVNLGDRIKTFIQILIQANRTNCTGDYFTRELYGGIVSEEVNFDFQSEADPTNSEGFFVHDVLAAIVERITGRADSFYSEYLGSPYTKARQYESIGCGSPYTLHKGLHVRGYLLSEKKFFASWKECWKGLNPIFNLGCGYETINGVEVIRVEPKAYFYDADPILQLSYLNNVEDSFDKDMIIKKITTGYDKGKPEEVRGLDDLYRVTRATRFKTIGKELSIVSNFIATSLTWEVTRRKDSVRSADYKFDDEIFILAINRDELAEETLTPELAENFDTVTNLDDYTTRYNLRLTPGRNFGRWYSFLNGCLRDYLDSVYKFVSAEGNYDLITDAGGSPPDICFDDHAFLLASFAESQDIDVGVDYLFTHEMMSVDAHPLSLEEYKEMRENRNNSLQTSTSNTDFQTCFVKRMELDPNRSKVKLMLWKR
jgi:hypothetical protein